MTTHRSIEPLKIITKVNEGYISENENRTIQKQNVISHEITKNKSALSKFYIF